MALVNEHFLKLPNNYLFSDIAKKVNAFKVMHPKSDVISLGIGDVTQPLCPAVTEAMHRAVDEMGTATGFHGYGPEQGYDFLREAILKNDFLPRGIHLDIDEIFINDGAKSDTGNIQELIRWDNSIGVTDPIYPVYIDSNVMIGRAGRLVDGKWDNVIYLPCTAENNFIPQIPKDRHVDVIYLCYPNNPTGTVISKDELRKWVSYARLHWCTLRLYHRTQRPDGSHTQWRTYPPESAMEPPTVHEIQRHELHLTTGGRGHLYSRGERTGEDNHRLLYAERTPDARHPTASRLQGLRWRECPLYLDEDTCRHRIVAVFRTTALWCQCGMYPWRRLRSQR